MFACVENDQVVCAFVCFFEYKNMCTVWLFVCKFVCVLVKLFV